MLALQRGAARTADVGAGSVAGAPCSLLRVKARRASDLYQVFERHFFKFSGSTRIADFYADTPFTGFGVCAGWGWRGAGVEGCGAGVASESYRLALRLVRRRVLASARGMTAEPRAACDAQLLAAAEGGDLVNSAPPPRHPPTAAGACARAMRGQFRVKCGPQRQNVVLWRVTERRARAR